MSDSDDNLEYQGDDPRSLAWEGFRGFRLRFSEALELHISVGDAEHLEKIVGGGALRGSVGGSERPVLRGSAELYGLHGGYEGDEPFEGEPFELRDGAGNSRPPVRTCHVTIGQGKAVELRAEYDKPDWPTRYVGRVICIDHEAPKAEHFFCDLVLPAYSFEKVVEKTCGPDPYHMEIGVASPDIACRGFDTSVWHLGQRRALRLSCLHLKFYRRRR